MADAAPDELYVRRWAPPGPAGGLVVLVHGLAEHSGRYEWVAERLTDAGYAVFGYDARGHGRSPGPRGHADRYATLLDDLDRMIDRAADETRVERRFLYGHSLGGALVLNHALRGRRPLAGVVASSPFLQTTEPPPAWKVPVAKALSRLWPTAPLDPGIAPGLRSHDPQVDIDYDADPLTHYQITARLAVEAIRAGRWAVEHASELATPTLLLHGDADAITSHSASARFARAAGPICDFRSWPGKLHELHFEDNRDEVLDAVLAWLAAR
ncbi:lysophospholipase [Botrimarina sp.]|uniref:alpha/beta hydrolase n=1 Tax=Botrimarina sp. TaxID=2795802 RepID=UPI0032EAFC08